MPDSIADTAVVLWLLLEAQLLLDAPEHASASAHLQHAINSLSKDGHGKALRHEAWRPVSPSSQADAESLYAPVDAKSIPADTDRATHR